MYKQYKHMVRNTLVSAMALSVNAYAQNGIDEDYGIEEIIVTSTKRETSLMETAVAVSAFGQESLDNQGVKNLLDIGDMVPNMQIALSPSDSGV